jgi:hypothetical protein
MDDLDTIDKAAMFLSTGLMFVGIVVLGFVETLTGQPHFPIATNQAGEVVAYGTFGPVVRTGFVVAGLLVLLAYAVYKLATPVETASETTDVSTAD